MLYKILSNSDKKDSTSSLPTKKKGNCEMIQ